MRGISAGVDTTCALGPRAAVGGRCGKLASSEIFCVGATRCAVAVNRAPQPPQNRESGAFSVPQLGQRIPSPSVTYLDGPCLITSRDPVGPCDTLTRYGMMQILDRVLTVDRQRGAPDDRGRSIAREAGAPCPRGPRKSPWNAHRKAGLATIFQKKGDLGTVRGVPRLPREAVAQFAVPMMNDRQGADFQAPQAPGGVRGTASGVCYRTHFSRHHGSVERVLRVIPPEVLTDRPGLAASRARSHVPPVTFEPPCVTAVSHRCRRGPDRPGSGEPRQGKARNL
jgi:hypothetical protein